MSTSFFTQKRRAYQLLWSKLDRYLLPHVKEGVVIAVSGGPDSRALLEAIATWKGRLLGRFVVSSIDHGIRKKVALEETVFIARRAIRLGFDTWTESLLTNGQTGEHDLRTLRYQALMGAAARYSCKTICLAHHKDDNAEGYFMALMGVGGGELGAAMSELSPMKDFFLCRPFLSLEKKQLLLALSFSKNTDFVIDSFDESKKNARAYVRYEIFPELFRRAPRLKKGLSIFSEAQQSHNAFLNTMVLSLIEWENDSAQIKLLPTKEPLLLAAALWHVLKTFSQGKDLRSSFAVVNSIVDELIKHEFTHKANKAGLDPTPNGFNVNNLSDKHYQFPGALVIKSPGKIVVRRV